MGEGVLEPAATVEEESQLNGKEYNVDDPSDAKPTTGDKEATEEKKGKEPPPPSVPFHKLFQYADAFDILLMIAGTLGAMVHGAALPVFFLFFGDLTNSLGTGDLGSVTKYALYLVYLGLAVWVGGWAEVAFWMQTGERQSARIRELYLAAILKQEIAFFDQGSSSGQIVAAVTGDVLLVQDAISEKVGNFLHFISTFIAGMAIGFAKVWQLALVILAVVPLIAVCGATYAVVLTGLTSKEQEAYKGAGEIAQQAISQVRTVYSFVAEETTLTKYLVALQDTLKLGIKAGLSKGLGMGGVFGVLFCAWALQFWYASTLVASGTINGGAALTTMFAVLMGGISLGQAMPNVQFFAKGQAAAFTIFETLKRQPAIDVNDPSGEKLEGGAVQGEITLTDVHFAYPARPDAPIFQGFSLTIPARSTVAIVGPSGSGKSTVVALIQRFYDPLAGTVALDGKDLRSLNLRSLRGHIGLVSQEPALFATTIRENILYGKPGAGAKEVEEAAKAANAHAFISELPEGYDTQVGERGTQMSGGQKQRIAIARAILRNPEILLLDEATSALDAQSERVVQEALDGVMGGRTTVVIAHRLSTIRNADLIAVVAKGKLVEQGKHDELMSRGETGEYASLVKMQLAAGEAGGEVQSAAGTINAMSSIDQQQSTLSEGSTGDGKEKEVVPHRPGNAWFRLFKMTLPELPFTCSAIVGAASAGAINPVFGLFLTTVIVAYYNPDTNAMRQEVNKWALVFVGLGAFSLGSYTLQHYSFGVVGENLTRRVREAMLRAILRYEIAWFDADANSSGAVAGRLSSDATLVKAAITDRISIVFQNSSLFLVAFVIAYILNWRMAAVVTATFPLMIISALGQQAFLKGFAGDLKAAHEAASTLAAEAVSNIRTVASFSLEDKLLGLFHEKLAAPQKRAVFRGQISGFGFGLSNFLMFASFALAFWYMTTIIPTYGSFDQCFKVFMVLIMTSFAIAETLTLAPDFVKGGAAISSFFDVVDREPTIMPDDPTAEIVPVDAASIKGEIDLKHVRFAYPTRPDVILFDDFNLHVPAGKSLALVGRSGSGKSSVVSLIERFYDPLAGRVCVDGRDIRSFNLRSLRLHIGLVSQEPALFNMTIRENILYGRESATEAEIIEAAKAANAHNYISSLPDAYETNVGERGTQLSGGQKQRVAIARAVLKNPAILLLDEATSALDAESERVVQEALDRLMLGRTSVVIAHRLSTIRTADTIAVVQDGKIIEKGTHDKLYGNSSSAYHALVKLQQAGGGAL